MPRVGLTPVAFVLPMYRECRLYSLITDMLYVTSAVVPSNCVLNAKDDRLAKGKKGGAKSAEDAEVKGLSNWSLLRDRDSRRL